MEARGGIRGRTSLGGGRSLRLADAGAAHGREERKGGMSLGGVQLLLVLKWTWLLHPKLGRKQGGATTGAGLEGPGGE